MKKTLLTSLVTSIALLSITACTKDTSISISNPLDSLNYFKEEAAKRIATPVFMLPRTIKTGEFSLQAYERVYEKNAPAILYIGRDSYHSEISSPESKNPVGLRLAAQDPKTNVIYLAQACQYVGNSSDCPEEYMSTKRHSAEVLAAFDTALNNIRGYHGITKFHIVGYDGGAGIATALAAKRDDIASLRTVAGILDTQFYAHINETEYSDKSLNPVDIASKLKNMPQHHFIGQLDQEVPPAIYHSYAQAMGATPCSDVTLVPDTDHENGWVEQWSRLRLTSFACKEPVKLDAVPFEPKTLDEIGGPKGISK